MKMLMERTKNNQDTLDNSKAGGTALLQSNRIRICLTLLQRETSRSVTQNGEPRSRAEHTLWTPNL